MRKILIDSLTDTSLYIEKKIPLNIIVNKSINNKGVLEIDENKNILISQLDSGDTELYRLESYNGEGGVMLYNSTTKAIQIANTGDFLRVSLDFEKGTKYYIGASLIKSSSVNVVEKSFVLDGLEGKNILKVFMNGRELISYRFSLNKLYILGSERELIDNYSDLVVYAYSSSNIQDETQFTIKYYQYRKVFDVETFFDQSYFEGIDTGFGGEKFINFDSVSIEPQVERSVYKRNFAFSKKYRINSISNRVDLNLFLVSGIRDLVEYVGSSEFRILLVNPIFGRIVLINNCTVSDGVGLAYDKNKNTKKFNIECGNYIDIYKAEPHPYNKGKYGKYKYGGGDIYLDNSHRNIGDR